MEFRTKGRGKERKVFPVSKDSKQYKQDYKEKPVKQHHMRNPSWTAKHTVKGDIKDMYRADNPEKPTDHVDDQRLYKKRLQNTADKEIVHQDKKQNKKQEKLLKKQEKQAIKQAKKEYHEDQQSEQEDRELAAKIDGRDGNLQ